MAATQVVPGVYRISLGYVNAFLLVADDLTLIDTGFPGDGETILEAVRSLGRRPEEIKRVLVTHCHSDHAGGLATIRRATGAPAYMHPADAVIVKEGRPQRPLLPAPGLVTGVMFRLFIRAAPPWREPTWRAWCSMGRNSPPPVAFGRYTSPGTARGNSPFSGPRMGGCSSLPMPPAMSWAWASVLAMRILKRGARALRNWLPCSLRWPALATGSR
jgi:hypothetical protein